MPIMISREEIKLLKELQNQNESPSSEVKLGNNKVLVIDKRIFSN